MAPLPEFDINALLSEAGIGINDSDGAPQSSKMHVEIYHFIHDNGTKITRDIKTPEYVPVDLKHFNPDPFGEGDENEVVRQWSFQCACCSGEERLDAQGFVNKEYDPNNAESYAPPCLASASTFGCLSECFPCLLMSCCGCCKARVFARRERVLAKKPAPCVKCHLCFWDTYTVKAVGPYRAVADAPCPASSFMTRDDE